MNLVWSDLEPTVLRTCANMAKTSVTGMRKLLDLTSRRCPKPCGHLIWPLWSFPPRHLGEFWLKTKSFYFRTGVTHVLAKFPCARYCATVRLGVQSSRTFPDGACILAASLRYRAICTRMCQNQRCTSQYEFLAG